MPKVKKVKVESAVAVLRDKLAKKDGKRVAEETLRKAVSAKRQKKEVTLPPKKVKNPKTGPAKKQPPPKKVDSFSSEEEEDDSGSEEVQPKKAPIKKQPPQMNMGNSSDDDSVSELDNSSSEAELDSEDEKPKKAPTKKQAPPMEVDSSPSEEESESDDEQPQNASAKKQPPQRKVESSSSEDKSGFEEDAPLGKADSSDSEDESDSEESEKQSKPSKDSSNKKSSEEENEEEPAKADLTPKVKSAARKADSKSEKSEPKTHATGSKTLFVGNLAFNVEKDDVVNFFRDAAEVVDVRLACKPDGYLKGFGHVEFATIEDAQNAVKLSGQELNGRAVKLEFALEKGADAPCSNMTDSNQSARGKKFTIFIKGFDSSIPEEEIRQSLLEHFGSCGEITRISVPCDHDSGTIKGYAHVGFKDENAFTEALGHDGSELHGCRLKVDKARPRGNDDRSYERSGQRGGRGSSAGRENSGRLGHGGRDGGHGRVRGHGGRGGGFR